MENMEGVKSAMKDKRVLITGATGFIGSHLVKRLVMVGANVNILVKKEDDCFHIQDILKGLNVWCGDLKEYQSVYSCVADVRPQIVFHLAASRDVTRDIKLVDQMIDINVKGTINLLKAILERKVALDCFINTGTCEEYGDAPVPFCEDHREVPVSPYSASKVATSYFCQMIHRTEGLPIVTLRPFLTYGPHQDIDMFIPSVIYHCLRGKDFSMTAGDQTREFNYITDIVDAYLLAATNKAVFGQIINIGNGVEFRIKEVAQKIIQITGSSIRLLAGKLPKRAGEASRFFCCNDKAKNILGWLPKVDLDSGLKETIQWYMDNLGIYPNDR